MLSKSCLNQDADAKSFHLGDQENEVADFEADFERPLPDAESGKSDGEQEVAIAPMHSGSRVMVSMKDPSEPAALEFGDAAAQSRPRFQAWPFASGEILSPDQLVFPDAKDTSHAPSRDAEGATEQSSSGACCRG